MKKIVVFFLVIFCFYGTAWGQDYPKYTIEQVNFAPERYVGLTIRFFNGWFVPRVGKWDDFGDIKYGLGFCSDAGTCSGTYYNGDLSFYMEAALTEQVLNAQLGWPNDSNIVCTIEKETLAASGGAINTFYLAKITAIEFLDSKGNVTTIMTDATAPLPPNPVGDAVAAERARWDADGDNKIGLAEAIRALQIVSGMR